MAKITPPKARTGVTNKIQSNVTKTRQKVKVTPGKRTPMKRS